MSDPSRDKTNSEKRLARLENLVGRLASRVKVLETELNKTNTLLDKAVKEIEDVRVSYFKNLARNVHGTEPPPAISAPEPSTQTQRPKT